MNRYLIQVDTNWCGEEQTFAAYANDKSELESTAQEVAYENFNSYPGTGFDGLLSDLFPDVEDEEYTDDMIDEAGALESEYYGFSIEPWDESRDETEWDWFELIYDGRKKENAEV